MLTARDVLEGVPWFIVGTRRDGSQLCLGRSKNRKQAERLAAQFAQHLEGYERIVAERVDLPKRKK